MKDLAERAVGEAQWAKQMVEDKKQQLGRTVKVSASKGFLKTGLAFLGANFRQAFEFYQNMGNHYFE